MRAYGIGELSSRSNVAAANIRYYEEIGILPRAERRNGRHRTYDDRYLSRLRFVRNSRELGFSLDQVRTLLLSDPRNLTCSEARELSAKQLETVQKRITDLKAIEAELSKHLAACDASCGGGRAPNAEFSRAPCLASDSHPAQRDGREYDIAQGLCDSHNCEKAQNGSRSTPAMTVSGSPMIGIQLRSRLHQP